jgi:ribosome-associated protein
MKFNLQPGYEFIQLNQLLKLLGLVETGGEANQVIADGEVKVNSITDTRKRRKLHIGDEVLFKNTSIQILAEEDD